MAKPILILAAIAALWQAAASAQARLNGDQLAYRMLHPDCVFPDLQDNPDFRLCGRHFLGDAGIAVVKRGNCSNCRGLSVKVRDFGGEPSSEQEPYPAALLLDSAWLVVTPFFSFRPASFYSPPDHGLGGSHYLSIEVYAYARDAAGRPVRRNHQPVVHVPNGNDLPYILERAADDEYAWQENYKRWADSLNDHFALWAAVYGCASIDECIATYPWFYSSNPSQSWGSLSNEQVARVARVIQLRIVNEACNIGLSVQPPRDVVVLKLRDDGRISGSCEPRHDEFRPCWAPDHDRPNSGLCIGQPEAEPEGYGP